MSINCYAARAAKKPLYSFKYKPATLSAWDIEVTITHCGVCHSDIHLIDNDWDISTYPLVPGHEIIGLVSRCGSEVKLKKGQRVGIGWQCKACLNCDFCLQGEEQLCQEQTATCLEHFGGFAEKIIVDSRFAFAIPEQLDSAHAAPLLCAGVTVYTPIRQYVVAPMRVGVIGIGGLGHLALQFLRAYGCEVTAFSSSSDKADQAKTLGAHHFIATNNKKTMQQAANSLDFILSTASADLNWQAYLELLKPKGKLCFVGMAPGHLKIAPADLISDSKTICSSVIGSRHLMREMLTFAARHNIKAQIEIMPMTEANTALKRVKKNQARYRIVLQN